MSRQTRLRGAIGAAAIAALYLLLAWRLKPDSTATAAENTAGLAAFRDVASVLASPRCLNCHLAGESPLQGDRGQPHNMNVKRGEDGRGSLAMRCTNCHQSTNSELPHAPAGAPDWRMPDAKTPMAWQGLNIGALCRALKDPSKNGNRDLPALVEHVRSDQIVNWGWNPGEGRSAPPLSHQQFVDKFTEWANGGAPCQP